MSCDILVFFLSPARCLTCVSATGRCSSRQQQLRQQLQPRQQQWPETFPDQALWEASPRPSVSVLTAELVAESLNLLQHSSSPWCWKVNNSWHWEMLLIMEIRWLANKTNQMNIRISVSSTSKGVKQKTESAEEHKWDVFLSCRTSCWKSSLILNR